MDLGYFNNAKAEEVSDWEAIRKKTIKDKTESSAQVFDSESFEIKTQRTVGSQISSELVFDSILAIVISLLIIFMYIAFRFKRWQFGLGALVAMFHDVLVVLGLFSLLYNIVPFSMEIDQAFIAAILTVSQAHFCVLARQGRRDCVYTIGKVAAMHTRATRDWQVAGSRGAAPEAHRKPREES